MKCHIPGQNVKILGRTVHALARFGDELYLESLPDCIVLRTLNAAESAYAMVKFNTSFFANFNYNYYSTTDNEGLKCKISMKSALHTFKSPAHMDKQVEHLEIKLDPEACKLIFQLRCKHGIVKTHFVSILDCKSMQTVYTKDLVPNRITSHQRVLSEALSNFQTSDDQVTMEVTTQTLNLRNYVDHTGDITKLIRTQVNLKPTEFENYTIGVDTTITFTLKEFRAILVFAEALNLPLQLLFETTGKPAVFVVHNSSTFEANFVLATEKADNGTQSNTSQHTEVESNRSKRKETTSAEQSLRKKAHIEKENSNHCLDEDSHLFNFVDLPDGNQFPNQSKVNGTFREPDSNKQNHLNDGCKSIANISHDRKKQSQEKVKESINGENQSQINESIKLLETNLQNFSQSHFKKPNAVLQTTSKVNKHSENLRKIGNETVDFPVINWDNEMDCEIIPTQDCKSKFSTIFSRCFESERDPSMLHQVLVAESDDSD